MRTTGQPTYPILSFVKLHSLIHPRATTEFVYRYTSSKEAFVLISFLLLSSPSSASGPSEEARAKEVGVLQAALADEGMEAVDLSDNEFAKSHMRHMIGGKADVQDERIFRFGESEPLDYTGDRDQTS
jgi:threonine dehydratase